ncbi:MAG TPA: beta-propeller fold lactonase family protein [Candidatus Aminicenantes bacterium]|nr:beta-propeller fold lactonase family protein [Candidatus Aminicenantes bacterium]
MRYRSRSFVASLALIAVLTGCGGGGGNTTPPAISVLVTPSSPAVILGASQQFNAAVSNTTNKSVTWSVTGAGTISASGLYTAPATLTTPATATVKATSQADTSKSDSVFVVIPAVSAAVSPAAPSVVLGASQQFTAVVGNATDTSVAWSLAGPGSITAAGLYAAPAALATPATATVTATPAADPAKASSTTVTIPAVTVSVSPGAAVLNARNARSFAAVVGNATDTSVSWSVTGGGTIGGSGFYTAPSTVAAPATATITATSVADPGKTHTATVTLSPYTVDVSGYVIMTDFVHNTLTVDAIDSATGQLRPNGQRFMDAEANPYWTIVHPSGKFAYAEMRSATVGVLGYAIGAGGVLSPVPGSPFPASWLTLSAPAITPDGKYLYILSYGTTGGLWAFGINASTGALTPIAGYTPMNMGFNGGALVASRDSKFLYAFTNNVSNVMDGVIMVYAIDGATGHLSFVQQALAPGVTYAKKMAVDPAGKFLYATSINGGKVVGLTIDPSSGFLTVMPGAPFAGDVSGQANAVTVDPQGQYLYLTGVSGIRMYTIDTATGIPTLLPSVYAEEAGDLEPDPAGNFVYANFPFTMAALSVDRSRNQLTFLNSLHSRTTTGAGRGLFFGVAPATTPVSYKPAAAFVLNSGDNTVSAYTVDGASGQLAAAGAAVSTGGTNPAALAADVFGQYLFVVNKDSDTVAAFAINGTTGALTAVPGSPYATGLAPTGVAVDPSGRVVYVANSGDGSLTVYALNSATGELAHLSDISSSGLCSGMRSLAVEPRGLYLFECCAASGLVLSRYLEPDTGIPGDPGQYAPGGLSLAVSPYGAAPPYTSLVDWHSFAFLIDPSDRSIMRFIVGNLGELQSPAAGPVSVDRGLALDPHGRYLYAADSGSNTIHGCAIDQSDGGLTALSGSPWASGMAPADAAVDISGRFLYVLNKDSRTVSGFYINRPDGALTPMSPPTFATGSAPVAILTVGAVR